MTLVGCEVIEEGVGSFSSKQPTIMGRRGLQWGL